MFIDFCQITNINRLIALPENNDTNATTINLIDDPNYALENTDWPIGAIWPDTSLRTTAYSETVHDLIVTVRGQTPNQATALADRLIRLVDDAALWWFGRGLAATMLRARATGSTQIYECAILGLASPPIAPTPVMQVNGYAVRVELRILRRARWLGRGYEDNNDTTNTEIYRQTTATGGRVVTFTTFTGAPPNIVEPLAVQVNPINATSNLPLALLVGRRWDGRTGLDARAGILRAAGYSASGAWSTLSGAAALALGDATSAGTIWRYTPAGTSASLSPVAGLWLDGGGALGFRTYTPLVLVALVARNNGATTYTVRALVTDVYTLQSNYTPPAVIDSSTTNPRVFILGLTSVQVAAGTIRLEVTASAAASNIDFDAIYVLDYGDPGGAAIIVDAIPTSLGANAYVSAQSPEIFNVNRGVVCDATDLFNIITTGLNAFRGGGSTGGIECNQAGVSAALLAPNGATFQQDTAGAGATWEVTRRRAALLPE